MIRKNISIHISEAESIGDLPAEDQVLVTIAREMTIKAYAPYSGFSVGAAVLLENGEVVRGSNQENGAYPSGLCAERVAVFAASAMYPGVAMKTIAISARTAHPGMDDPVSPCGACRQVMLEYEVLQQKSIKLLLSNEKGKIVIIDKVEDLLPLSFTGVGLKK